MPKKRNASVCYRHKTVSNEGANKHSLSLPTSVTWDIRENLFQRRVASPHILVKCDKFLPIRHYFKFHQILSQPPITNMKAPVLTSGFISKCLSINLKTVAHTNYNEFRYIVLSLHKIYREKDMLLSGYVFLTTMCLNFTARICVPLINFHYHFIITDFFIPIYIYKYILIYVH